MSASLCLIAWNERDRATEGEASERVLARHVQRRLRAADLLEGQQDGGAVEQALDAAASPRRPSPSGSRGAHRRSRGARASGSGSTVETAPGGHRARPGRRGRARARRPPRGPGEHDREVGHVAVGHRHLGAADAAAGALVFTLPASATGPSARAKHADRLALREPRQPALLLLFAARQQQRLGGQIDRRRERRRREAAAELLGDHAQLEIAEAGAAVFLGNGRAEPAHLGHAAPERLVVGRVGLEDAAHLGRATSARRGTFSPGRAAPSGRERSRSS